MKHEYLKSDKQFVEHFSNMFIEFSKTHKVYNPTIMESFKGTVALALLVQLTTDGTAPREFWIGEAELSKEDMVILMYNIARIMMVAFEEDESATTVYNFLMKAVDGMGAIGADLKRSIEEYKKLNGEKLTRIRVANIMAEALIDKPAASFSTPPPLVERIASLSIKLNEKLAQDALMMDESMVIVNGLLGDTDDQSTN